MEHHRTTGTSRSAARPAPASRRDARTGLPGQARGGSGGGGQRAPRPRRPQGAQPVAAGAGVAAAVTAGPAAAGSGRGTAAHGTAGRGGAVGRAGQAMDGIARWSGRMADSARGSRISWIAATANRGATAADGLRRFPNPRLTGLGCGLLCTAAMVVLGLLSMLLGTSVTVYGLLFLPVSLLTAMWVRPGDLLTAPIVGPIAYALGLLFIADGNGVGGQAMGFFTALATGAGWLYGGVLVTGLVATGRWIRFTSGAGAGPAGRES